MLILIHLFHIFIYHLKIGIVTACKCNKFMVLRLTVMILKGFVHSVRHVIRQKKDLILHFLFGIQLEVLCRCNLTQKCQKSMEKLLSLMRQSAIFPYSDIKFLAQIKYGIWEIQSMKSIIWSMICHHTMRKIWTSFKWDLEQSIPEEQYLNSNKMLIQLQLQHHNLIQLQYRSLKIWITQHTCLSLSFKKSKRAKILFITKILNKSNSME